jgi:hypothetical protein
MLDPSMFGSVESESSRLMKLLSAPQSRATDVEYLQTTSPAPTEGSADPAQSDQEEVDAITANKSNSTSINSTRSWARFRVVPNTFTSPADPARRELYDRIL